MGLSPEFKEWALGNDYSIPEARALQIDLVETTNYLNYVESSPFLQVLHGVFESCAGYQLAELLPDNCEVTYVA